MDWDQWKTILWLRWRLTRNQWARRSSLNEIVGILLAVLLVGGAVFSAGLGFVAGSWFANRPAHFLLIVWDVAIGAFLFWWLIGLLAEIQRRESLDLSRLMHLPISLRKVFVFNYLVSWVTPSIILILPGFIGLALGLAVYRGFQMLLLLPVIFGFLFVTTSWTYLLRGWLASLMANERRRRTIVVIGSFILIGVTQLPNLYFQMSLPNSSRHHVSEPALPPWFGPAHYALPPLWVGKSAETLASGRPFFTLAATGGTLVLGGLALYLGYCATLRAYLGSPKFSLRAPSAEKMPASRPSRLLEQRLPFVSEEVGVIALATIQSHLRAPEVKMVLFSQLLMNLVFGFMVFRPGGFGASFASGHLFIGSVIAMFSMMGASQLFFNQFGFDRDGFRAFVLSPVARKSILFGKALGTFPLVATVGLVLLLAALFLGLLSPALLLASLITLVAAYLCFVSLGNWLSIISPYRMAQGSLKPTKSPPQIALIIFASLLFSPLAAGLIFLPAILGFLANTAHWGNSILIQLGASVLLLGFGAILFLGTSGPLGRLLMRRERAILLAVTQELE